MLIVVDAMCAEYGGVRTYAEHLLAHWSDVHPEDVLHVVVPRDSTLDTAEHARHELTVRRPRAVGRPLAQTFAMHRLIDGLAPDAVLATVPSTTVRRPRSPMVVTVHDLRHEIRPRQFSWQRRLLRRVSYGRAYALADAFCVVSQRSLNDLHARHPRTSTVPATVTHLGADHVASWPTSVGKGPCVAFAHHTNKNPVLVLDAWVLLASRLPTPPQLVLVGVPRADRDALAGAIARRELDKHVTLAPYLADEAFRMTLASAAAIVFPSDFEGFGLPVVEGMALGVPVVITPDPAMTEVAGGHAVTTKDWTAKSLADAVARAHTLGDAEIEAGRAWARTFTWSRTVALTRSTLAETT